jgi:hypothetical protein
MSESDTMTFEETYLRLRRSTNDSIVEVGLWLDCLLVRRQELYCFCLSNPVLCNGQHQKRRLG